MGYYQWPYVQIDPNKYWDWTKESLTICADYAGKKGITLTLEIEPTTRPEESLTCSLTIKLKNLLTT